MKFILAAVFAILACFNTFAQTKFTINGTIKDAKNGEVLIGATIYNPENSMGVVSNEYGFYSITLNSSAKSLVFSYLGYDSKTITLKPSDTRLNIELAPKSNSLKEVLIQGESVKDQVKSTQMGMTKLTAKEAKNIPALFGEVDIIKTLQLKPGVQSNGEGTSGLYVRGGGADQNLFILDEAIVYNANHLFGFFSTFNSDAVKSVDLYKSDFPARFGGRLSSVVDVKMNDGNRKKFSGTGGIGTISSRLTLETPIIKDKGSVMISGRRTYFDIITRQVNASNADNPDAFKIPDYYFYDLNAKANYDIGPKDKLYLSGYFGRDVFGFNDQDFNFDFNWGNATGTARWNHEFSPRLFANTSFIYSNYDYTIANKFDRFTFKIGSEIRDISLKTDFTYQPNTKHNIRFGAMAIRHNFTVSRLNFASSDGSINFNQGKDLTGTELGIYGSDDLQFSTRLKLNLGLRISGFTSDSATYVQPEPRVGLNYSLTENSALKLSYARMTQYVNLIANSGASLPTDIWYPATKNVKPQLSSQVSAGYSRSLFNDKVFLSNEVYYKWLNNQIDLKDGAQIFVNENLEGEFVFGDGWAYGNEIYLEKKSGRLTGWVGYTLAWAWRQFDASNGNPAINGGNKFHPTYDRRHDISVVAMYKINNKLSASATWVYATGSATTLPIGYFPIQDIQGAPLSVVPDITERNGFRYAAYHRMDVGLVWKFSPRWGESDLTIGIYNLYDRRNPYFIYYDQGADAAGNPNFMFTAKQVSLFPILPSITYNFKF